MHVFIPVFFNAPLGGLQSHVRAQVRALLGAGHVCTVMCKPGPFADSARRLGAAVLETDYERVENAVTAALSGGPYDLVHAHPFASRMAGLEVARHSDLPFFLTLHGMYIDSLPKYSHDITLLLAVSAAIRDFVVQSQALPAERVAVIPNGVDTDVFYPGAQSWEDIAGAHPALGEAGITKDERRILFACRLDPDKQFILDVVQETWAEMQRTRAHDLRWLVAGDGALGEALRRAADEWNRAAGQRLITFLGWLDEPTLAKLYNACHLCIAPGRSALDCMACGTAVIAIGSKGYVGLVDESVSLRGMHTNFGGFGAKHDDYVPGSMFADIDRVIYDDDRLASLGRLSSEVVRTFYRQSDLDQKLLGFYAACADSARCARRRPTAFQPATRPGFAFGDPEQPGQLSSAWTYEKGDDRRVTTSAEGHLCVDYHLAEGDKFYVTSGSTNFTRPPQDASGWSLKPNQAYELRTTLRVRAGRPTVAVWFIEYDEHTRLAHVNTVVRQGDNRVRSCSSGQARSFKVAFRFAGVGTAVLSPIELLEILECAQRSVDCQRRSLRLPGFHEYEGENLVFIMGPPRSGTTWLLRLLAEHPEVEAASVENLDVRLNDAPTLETNIFNRSRPYTDSQIKFKFYRLSRRNPGKVIVEKTPIHLLFVDRIRRVLPRAALVLTERDGRDVVNSLLHVGRDSSAWWQGAPDSVEKATSLWKQYAEAGLRCARVQRPYVARYERWLDNPRAELIELLSYLGLSCEHVDRQIEACRQGKNIPIAGVFREGKSGSWRRSFTPQDVETFKQVGGATLIQIGYVSDASWDLS